MERKSAKRTSAKERERRAKEIIAAPSGWLDTDARLAEWERFFRSVMKPFLDSVDPYNDPFGVLKKDAPQIAHVAREGLVSLAQAKSCIAANNSRGTTVSLLDMAFSACRICSLDEERARNLKRFGPAANKSNAEVRHKAIREAFDVIMAEQPPPSLGGARLGCRTASGFQIRRSST